MKPANCLSVALTCSVSFALLMNSLPAAEPTAYLRFIQNQGLSLHQNDHAAESLDAWQKRKSLLRQNLIDSLGGFPETDCDLEPRILGGFQGEGYRVEKLIFQTRPGIWMTANAYVPDLPGRLPAVLHVHGHWKGAKQDPVVQSRCIGCAKLGFFVLCVDAFGAGERAIQKNLGEYHGEMTAATLLPVGLPLPGLQVYENKRAVDYLISRPEVDPDRIGITGASRGGNQSMYAGALDERLKCVVPTCSVGTYQSYLGAACCLCELIPGGLKLTEEGDLLGLAANRGVMVTSATKDAFQFSVGEAQKSFARLESIAKLYPSARVKHTIVESPHDYNRTMREAMYGWMTLHLKQQGDGSPIPDPEIQPEDPEKLRCFPGSSRPDDFVTIPQFAGKEGQRLAALRKAPSNRQDWEKTIGLRKKTLEQRLGGFPKSNALDLKIHDDVEKKLQTINFSSEPGLELHIQRDLAAGSSPIALLLDVDRGIEKLWSDDLTQQLRAQGYRIAAAELRATGRFAQPGDQIAHAPDHNTSEWGIWIGRPLLGQWVHDVRRTLDAMNEADRTLPPQILLVGRGSAGVIALCTTALDSRISNVRAIDTLATYVTDKPYRSVRLGVMVPGILRDVGDVADITAMIAPRPVTIEGGLMGSGERLERNELSRLYGPAQSVYQLLEAGPALTLSAAP